MPAVDFEEMTRDSVNARRNYFMGLWAGREIGLKSDALQAYAYDVMKVDERARGAGEMIRKLRADLARNGCPVSEVALMERLKVFDRNVRAEICVTD